MYFNQLARIFLRSYRLWRKDYKFLWIGLFMALFGFSVQGIRIFSSEYIQTLFLSSNEFKIAYVSWEIVALIAFVLGGSILFPILIILVREHEEGKKINMAIVYNEAKEKYYSFMILLVAYYAIISFLTGGGFILILQSLLENILYGTTITVIPHTFLPILAIYLTIGVVISFFVSLVFIFTINNLVFESKKLAESIILSIKMINKDIIYVFSAWIFVNIILIFPVLVAVLLLHSLVYAIQYVEVLKSLGFLIGIVIFLVVYVPVTMINNIFWTEIYMRMNGKVSLSNQSDQQ